MVSDGVVVVVVVVDVVDVVDVWGTDEELELEEELDELDEGENTAGDADFLCFLVGGSFSFDVVDLLQSAMISAIVIP